MAVNNIQGGQNVMAVSGEALQGPGGAGGLLNAQKDTKQAATEDKFGDVLKTIQAKYGKKDEKPRDIKKTLDKDDFMKIMFTQMKFQDPTNPFKPEQMAAEMAQFTSVEQLNNVNQNLMKLTQAHQPAERLAMANLLGKTVTIDRDRFTHTDGSKEAITFNLPRDAKKVTVTLISETGETILTKEMGAQKAGEVLFDWDGKKSNTLPAKAGNYMLKIAAEDEQEKTINVSGKTSAKVVGLSFEGSEPVFLVGDAKSPTKVTMKNIVRIDDDGAPAGSVLGGAGAANISGANGANSNSNSGSSASAGSSSSPGNFFTFEKGVGSKTLDLSQASPDVKAALSSHQNAQTEKADEPNVKKAPVAPSSAAAPASAAKSAAPASVNPALLAHAAEMDKNNSSKGFPSGLSSSD